MPLAKTAAIRAARATVSPISRRSSTDYVFTAPYHNGEPRGARTEIQCNSYAAAVARRRTKIADVALALMGVPSQLQGDEGVSVETLVAYGVLRRDWWIQMLRA
ncbi:MAG: hypothetical protein AB9M53_00705 [Leptothrix sp. (in: b-proteobacteria)]